MSKQHIVVTGAAGLLGSAIVADLARDHLVEAIDWRPAGTVLAEAAPQVGWHQADIGNQQQLAAAFLHAARHLGSVDVVLHFAAYYHFGTDWRSEYERTNIQGTTHLVQLATQVGAERLIFASSTMATLPPDFGTAASERTAADSRFPYGRSKARGEQIVRENSERLPAIILRIGGVFSDWCELPPLCSLIRLWRGRFPWCRLVVGRGDSGIPYLHRSDLVRLVRRCIDCRAELGNDELLLASQHGAVIDRDLFPLVVRPADDLSVPRAWYVPTALARAGLWMKLAAGRLTGDMPFERPWMLAYVDRPWVTDTTYTREKLGWHGRDAYSLANRLPRILDHFDHDRRAWESRNRRRNEGRYSYLPDAV